MINLKTLIVDSRRLSPTYVDLPFIHFSAYHQSEPNKKIVNEGSV